jgi:N-acetylmuramoyl-L-alanine amidase
MKFLFLIYLAIAINSTNVHSAVELAIKDTLINGVQYGSADALTKAAKVNANWNPLQQKFHIQSSPELVLTNDNPFALYGDSTLFLGAPALWINQKMWFPMNSLANITSAYLNSVARWIPEKKIIELTPPGITLAIETKSNGEVAVLSFPTKIAYESWHHTPHFILRLENTKLDTAVLNKTPSQGLIRKVISIQDENSAQITFQISESAEAGEIIEKENGLQIVFRKKPKAPAANPQTINKNHNSKKIKNIIIDAGHGGKDPGALGAKSQEKDITLAVALKLKKDLLAAGFNPKLTRETDIFIDLQERPKLASKWDGDLFISLHCNAIDGNEAKKMNTSGYKIFILREAKSEEDKALARRENNAIMLSSNNSKSSKNEISPVEWILMEHQLNMYTKYSESFTANIVEELSHGKIPKHGHGAGQAGFYVLVGAYMPAVLVELGFITNPKDEAWMNSEKGQKELSSLIAKSIIKYQESLEQIH